MRLVAQQALGVSVASAAGDREAADVYVSVVVIGAVITGVAMLVAAVVTGTAAIAAAVISRRGRNGS